MSTAPTDTPVRNASRAPLARGWARTTARALRVVAGLYALGVFAQALFAGQFLSGQGQWLIWHDLNGTAVLTWVVLVQFVLALIVWLPGKGPAWPALVSVAQFAGAWLQIETGYGNVLAVHVPLGVALFGSALALWFGAGRLIR
jgi:hypothetical protein